MLLNWTNVAGTGRGIQSFVDRGGDQRIFGNHGIFKSCQMASNKHGIGQNQHDELGYQVCFIVARQVMELRPVMF
jgi:hypothetical protein